MGDYLIVSRPASPGAARLLSSELRAMADAAGLSVSDLSAQVWLAVGGPQPPVRHTLGPWTLIGDVFDRAHASMPRIKDDDPFAYVSKLVARVWGRYVGVRLTDHGEIAAVIRDPSGALECIAWSQDGLTILASTAPDWLIRRLRPPWTVNIDRLAHAMRDPLMSSGALLIDGPMAIDPGTVQPMPLSRTPTTVWRPAQIARQSLETRLEPRDAAAMLRSAIDEAVVGLAGPTGSLAVEVSGGIDSSIVAASLARHGADHVKLWINAHGASPEADERVYVAALGETLGIMPVSVPHAVGPITEALLESISQDFRPGLNALDVHHDLDWVNRLTRAGVGALLTGKGGDSILLQSAGPDVFVDLWQARGWRALLAPDTARLAATNEMSVWSMVREALRYGRQGGPRPALDDALLTPISAAAPLHPWLEGCEAFGPAKTFQIAGVVDSVSRHGRSLLTEAIDVRHPLCAQPVVEACLAMPTSLLTLGGRGRGLAREAFRDRLPPLITERRSKGDMTRIYGRMILDNLHVLRPWLLDGRLAAAGVIDRSAAETALAPEALMWRGRYSAIMRAAAFEGWLRVWSRRLAA